MLRSGDAALQEIEASFSTRIPAGFRKIVGISHSESGKWRAIIRNPVTKVHEQIGFYNTAEEAESAYRKKKLEIYDMTNCLNKLGVCTNKEGLWHNANAGKWGACIRHPITKLIVWLGTYDTPESASHAYKQNKQDCAYPEFEGCSSRQSVYRTPLGVTLTKLGRWRATIPHPMTKSCVKLGTYDTPKEAEEARTKKKLEFDSMFPTARKRRNTSSKWYAVIQDPISRCHDYLGLYDSAEQAAEALRRKKRQFDLMVSVENVDSAMEHEIADDNMDVQSTESQILRCVDKEESDMGVIDAFGRLIGEFSRMDDELWLV